MRILQYCPYGGGVMYEWHDYHMIAELQAAGHIVVYCNPVKMLGRKGTAAEYSEILPRQVESMMDEGGCDLLFAMARDTNTEPSAIIEIRRKGVPCVNFHCDDLTVPYRLRKIGRSFDLQWITARQAEPLVASYGAKVVVLPMAANPHFFRRVSVAEERVVGFIGSLYGARARYIVDLVNSGIPICIYGKSTGAVGVDGRLRSNPAVRALGRLIPTIRHMLKSLTFETGRRCIVGAVKRSLLELVEDKKSLQSSLSRVQFHGSPTFEEIPECYSRLGLSLGSLHTASTYVLRRPLMYIRLREFEAAMCGAVHIANRFPELQEHFEEDCEMLFYSDVDELVDKAKFYLAPQRDALREQIRQRARRRAENDHTWLRRFSRIWEILGIA